MGNPKDLKDSVKALYMQGKEATEIAGLLGVAASTIYNWIDKDRWKAERQSRKRDFSRSPEKLLDALDDLMGKMAESLTPDEFAKYADSYCKIAKSHKSLFKDYDRFDQVIFVIGEFGSHVREESKTKSYPQEFFDKLDKLLQSFQQKMILKYSPKNMQ